jgi:DNA polymerase-4
MQHIRKIIHIDMDAFFASVEQMDNPELVGRAVIVGGRPEGMGVVAACSYEARRFGVRSAMACARAARLCPRAIFTRPRMDRYREVSSRIMAIFREYTSLVEPLSVDEAFLDVTVNHFEEPSATLLARRIREHIRKETGLTASAGISFNKFLAKVASDLNKPDGMAVIPPDRAIEFLDALPIGKFYGVGRVTEKKMLRLGITTGRELRRLREEELLMHFGKMGSFLYQCVRGHDDRTVDPVRVRKSIGTEKTFTSDTDDLIEINAALWLFAEKIEANLQAKDLTGHTLTLKIRYGDFTTITRSLTSRHPLREAAEMFSLARGLMTGTAVGREKIRLLGLSISNLEDRDSRPRQLLLPFHLKGDQEAVRE